MIKNTLIIIFLVFINYSIYAQDTIVSRNGDKISSKVLEVTTTEIKYKRFDNIDGPTYSILKSDVSVIKYQNGTSDDFNNESNNTTSSTFTQPQINDDTITIIKRVYSLKGVPLTLMQMVDLMRNYPEAYSEIKKAKSIYFTSIVCGEVGGACVGASLGILVSTGSFITPIAVVGAVFIIIDISMAKTYINHITKAVRLYNSQIIKK